MPSVDAPCLSHGQRARSNRKGAKTAKIVLSRMSHLNRASSDSRRSWRGQADPTNDAYRTGRGLRQMQLGLGEIGGRIDTRPRVRPSDGDMDALAVPKHA